MKIILLLLSLSAFAQTQKSLKDLSQELNQGLPANYDHITRLLKTTVENNHLVYHFVLNVSPEEYQRTISKVKTEVQKTICLKAPANHALKNLKVPIVYRYENISGISLGEFMTRPDHCRK